MSVCEGMCEYEYECEFVCVCMYVCVNEMMGGETENGVEQGGSGDVEVNL